jgi:hypothetical protein
MLPPDVSSDAQLLTSRPVTWNWEPEGEPFELAANWYLPSAATITFTKMKGMSVDVELHVVLRHDVYRCDRVEIREQGDGGVTSASLREIPITDLLRTWMQRAGTHYGTPPGWRALRDLPELERVVVAYKMAAVIGDPPTEAVADALKISRSYASRKVMKAREAGLLAPAPPRGR